MEHYQPTVLDSVWEVASSDRGEYTVVQHGSKPTKRHVYSVSVNHNSYEDWYISRPDIATLNGP